MNGLRLHGVFEDKGLLWTRNRVPGQSIYGEKLRLRKGTEYRSWSPFRSKMAALIRKDQSVPWPDWGRDILYLGASSGTTVSHVSDMLKDGAHVHAVEFSPRSARDLLWNIEPRNNVIPIIEDAGRPGRYAAYIDRPVGTLIQDVAQRHQVDIFLRNMTFLADGGLGFLFVKARSINVAQPTQEVYADVATRLKDAGLHIVKQVDLDSFEKDHRAFIIEKKDGKGAIPWT